MADDSLTGEAVTFGPGYDPAFLGVPVGAPRDTRGDTYELDGSPIIDYTHFSLALSAARCLPIWVAWNIDGASLFSVPRENDNFRPDDRLPESAQTLNAYYSDPKLDRGHIARRADLAWGERAEGLRAMDQSFFFTNVTPQMANFNQSRAGGLWGQLENAILDQRSLHNGKVSVMGGPVLSPSDPVYRERRLPLDFWKVLVYRVDSRIRAKSFVLEQNIAGLESLDPLDNFAVYQRPLVEIQSSAGVAFDGTLLEAQDEVAAAEGGEDQRLTNLDQIDW
jgi:endonuclease G